MHRIVSFCVTFCQILAVVLRRSFFATLPGSTTEVGANFADRRRARKIGGVSVDYDLTVDSAREDRSDPRQTLAIHQPEEIVPDCVLDEITSDALSLHEVDVRADLASYAIVAERSCDLLPLVEVATCSDLVATSAHSDL